MLMKGLLVVAVALSLASGRRLKLGKDGFARVDSPSNNPVSGITVSSWVNITEFPGGVAPVVTLISEDANYQIAFFIREDGAGVLWGGPASSKDSIGEEYSDRQPRFSFPSRSKRSAVDYSMGLGDVMNIMPRKERSNTWTPMNFVDVSEMGVADLETSGTSNQDHYEDWYDVGYELQMQESADPGPKLITQPSGDNEFVVFNWNDPSSPSFSTNQWDSLGNQVKPNTKSNSQVPDTERYVWSREENRAGSKYSQGEAKPSQTRNTLPPIFRVPLTTSERPTTTERKRLSRPFIPGLTRNSETRKSRPGLFRYNRRPTTEAPTTTTSRPRTTRPPTITRAPTTTTTVVKPVASPVIQETRVPLWARLKKTSAEETTPEKKVKQVKNTTTTTTTSTTTTTTTTAKPQVYQASGSSHRRVTARPPIAPVRRTTVRPQPTRSQKEIIPHKQISKQKAQQQRINSSKERKLNKNRNQQNNKQFRPLQSHNMDEFRRILEGKPAIEDTGNKVVVYSMPITDVDHFNRMYDRYQETEAKDNPRINLHVVYERAREGGHQAYKDVEDETNQNQIEEISEPLPVLTYKEEPLQFTDSQQAGQNYRETILRKPVLAEPINLVRNIDEAPFKPSRPANSFSKYEREYLNYSPDAGKIKIVLSEDMDESNMEPTDEEYSVDVPLLSVAAAALSNLQNPLIYQPAVLAQQDIGGEQVGFYQEPSRISHQQLPPEYMEESRKDNSIPTNDQHIRRSYDTNVEVEQEIPQPVKKQFRYGQTQTKQHNNRQQTRYETRTRPEIKPSPAVVTESPLNVNFRKMPYEFNRNTWYHITFTWSSEDHALRIFVNGEIAGILEDTMTERQVLPTKGVMLLGKTLLPSLSGFDPTSHLTGEMSNYVVWSEALTPREVKDAFKCEAAPSYPVMLTWSATPLRVYNDAQVNEAPPICGISSS